MVYKQFVCFILGFQIFDQDGILSEENKEYYETLSYIEEKDMELPYPALKNQRDLVGQIIF